MQDTLVPSPPLVRLTTQTARELAQQEPDDPPFLVEGFLYEGSITELGAKIKAGKTTFAMHMLRSLLEGGAFLGKYDTRYGQILYLTEERPATFKAALGRAGLLERDDLHIIYLHQTKGMSWPEVAKDITSILTYKSIKLLVVDTLSRWLKVTDENDSAEAGRLMLELEQIAAQGYAVLVTRHGKKGDMGADVGEMARGGTGYGGSVDIILELWRANQNGHANRRIVRATGRFDNLPEKTYIDLEGDHYVIGGEGDDQLEKGMAQTLTWAAIDGPVTMKQLAEKTRYSRSTLQRALEDMEKKGQITRRQEGRSLVYEKVWPRCAQKHVPL